MWDLSSLTRDQTRIPCIGRRSLNLWTAGEVPDFPILDLEDGSFYSIFFLLGGSVSSQLRTAAATAAKSLQSCLTQCDPKDDSPSGSTFPGILQARTLEWVAISFSSVWKWKLKVKSLSLWLSDPMDCSLPGSSVHGIFQARVLEWGAGRPMEMEVRLGAWGGGRSRWRRGR